MKTKSFVALTCLALLSACGGSKTGENLIDASGRGADKGVATGGEQGGGDTVVNPPSSTGGGGSGTGGSGSDDTGGSGTDRLGIEISGGGTAGPSDLQMRKKPAIIDEFSVDAAPSDDAKFSTYKVKFAYANASEAYIWGNILNRTAEDAKESAPCLMQGSRYLITGPKGGNVAPGGEAFERWKYLATGEVCNEEKCLNGSIVATDKSRRIPSLATGPALCRVALKNDAGKNIIQDHFFTRSLAGYGNLCLQVKGQDGRWAVECVDGEDVSAAKAAMKGKPKFKAAGNKSDAGVLALSFDFVNSVSVTVDGCLKTEGAKIDADGSGHYEGVCNVASDSKKITVTFKGATGDLAPLVYRVSLGNPHIDLSTNKDLPNDKPAEFLLRYKVWRTLEVKDSSGHNLADAGAHVGWLKAVNFKGNPLDVHAERNIKALEGEVTVRRDLNHEAWTVVAVDYDGKETEETFQELYPASFTVRAPIIGLMLVTTGTGASCDEVDKDVFIALEWEGTDIKSLSSGDCTLSEADSALEDLKRYGKQSGSVYLWKNLGGEQDAPWTANLDCDLNATTMRGEKITLRVKGSYSCTE